MTEAEGGPERNDPVLAVVDIDKSFPGVHALKHATFDCLPGEIHGLVGENGAGKSTLMRVLAGVLRPDSGCIHVRGDEVELTSPRHAHDLGIAMVYQDTRLVDDLDIAQNIWLEGEPGAFLLIDRRTMAIQARSILQRLGLKRSEEHTSELQSRQYLVCRLLLEKKKNM